MNQLKLRSMLEAFLLEDIGNQDLSTQAIFPLEETGAGVFLAKDHGILAGTVIITEVYHLLDPSITVKLHGKDGDTIEPGDKIAHVSGSVQHLLSGERVILNLLQRMSGIATRTNQCVRTLDDASIRILDTRKTTPGLRMFEKYAVRIGGGHNHRFGLYDGIMIKDNHIAFCGSITEAVKRAKANAGHMVKIEVETESEQHVREAVQAGADVIMFDNQTPEQVKYLTSLVPPSIWTEASGNIDLNNLADYQNCGVNGISLGMLTHSVNALDISFLEIHGKPEAGPISQEKGGILQ